MSILSDGITLVDIHSLAVPITEKNGVPHDLWDNPYWDVWQYEISDPTERAELEAAAVEHLTDLVEAPMLPAGLYPPDFEPDALDLDSFALPPVCGGAPSARDTRDFETWQDQVGQPFPPNGQPTEPRPSRYLTESLARIAGILRSWPVGP
jgi:hypothetical protein